MKTWIFLLAAVAAVANAAADNVDAGAESSLAGVEKRCVGGKTLALLDNSLRSKPVPRMLIVAVELARPGSATAA
ncbi:hypothetical protein BO99DRAFT_432939 [Aspergillus violaceofuscus CBS 115571]|uniref:Uncharacterized protein n=1 Tax=Aspergillus violaceofuscus (strain CBS 115571) TaxID=1450538 RepID=A0A2V5HRV5_ASPV1|nr:hypothetical protein BO99DRAFT_432939 [Aspergillus violaceofuscus CBS 115571]